MQMRRPLTLEMSSNKDALMTGWTRRDGKGLDR